MNMFRVLLTRHSVELFSSTPSIRLFRTYVSSIFDGTVVIKYSHAFKTRVT